ncbi:MAG: hypothetical protein AD742_06845 [Methylibium sp. NZG]|nr:MAG: hypothetical protein AD742_06845 [Methylibium sp. NZG]
MDTTTLSSRGQIVIPKALRESKRWRVGTSFVVEEVPQGILLKPLSTFTPSKLEDVLGCTSYRGPALSQADIEGALADDLARRFAAK